MTELAKKSEGIRRALDFLAAGLYGRPASQCIQEDVCVKCGQPAVEFADEVSKREFAISGLCQACQDVVFAEDED